MLLPACGCLPESRRQTAIVAICETRSMSTVFISYRRENTAGEARALFNDLISRLGEGSVFMDVDSIALGRDFRSILQETTASRDVMLVLIGRNWADARDDGGRIRLESPRITCAWR